MVESEVFDTSRIMDEMRKLSSSEIYVRALEEVELTNSDDGEADLEKGQQNLSWYIEKQQKM